MTQRRASSTLRRVGYSRFYLCDLHVHTAADARQGYGDAGGRDPNPEFARRLIEAHAAAGVEVMAVSDHNRVDWYPVLREAGDRAGVYVFPAVEFSVNRCHLLAIWDRTEQGYSLAEQFLTTLWPPGADRFEHNHNPRPVAKGQVLELAQRGAEHKALVLAPHATMKDIGFFGSGVCSNRKDVIASGYIAGYDIVGKRSADVLGNPAAEFGEDLPSWFISGDVRGFADIGTRATYLKLGPEPTLEGLRQAFLIPETRIRFPGSLRDQWGNVVGVRFVDSVNPTWPRIARVSIAGGFHNGLSLDFAPGLNAIIGGKGTGKSTLVEILRYALHAGDPQEIEARGNRESNFRVNAEAAITFIDAKGDEYRVQRTGGREAGRLLRNGQDLGLEVTRRVTVRVFGQRELQKLAEHHEILREFVAAEAGDEWTEVRTIEQGLISTLQDIDNKLTGIEVQLTGLEEAEGALTDVTDKISNATAKGAADLIDRLSALGDADDRIKASLEWPTEVSDAAGALREVLPIPRLPDAPWENQAIDQALSTLATVVSGSVKDVTSGVTRATAALQKPAEDWAMQLASERDTIERALADAGLADPQELGRLQGQARALQNRLADLPAKRQRARNLAAQRADALRTLGEVRRHKSRLVEGAARSLDVRIGSRVRIRVDPLSDITALLTTLEEAVRGQGVRAEQLRRLADTITATGIAAAIRAGQAKVEALGCSATTASKLCALDASAVRQIEEADVPDRIIVEVDLSSGTGDEAWHDVGAVSPGQRATALLALALAGGKEPLIIDQPEDDLDNRYIYDEVVSVLAEVCQSRQVIVATHNANIPILGDAELVLALDAEATQGTVLACGGLEDPDVARWARKILEGGEAAFQARHRRYQAAKP